MLTLERVVDASWHPTDTLCSDPGMTLVTLQLGKDPIPPHPSFPFSMNNVVRVGAADDRWTWLPSHACLCAVRQDENHCFQLDVVDESKCFDDCEWSCTVLRSRWSCVAPTSCLCACVCLCACLCVARRVYVRAFASIVSPRSLDRTLLPVRHVFPWTLSAAVPDRAEQPYVQPATFPQPFANPTLGCFAVLCCAVQRRCARRQTPLSSPSKWAWLRDTMNGPYRSKRRDVRSADLKTMSGRVRVLNVGSASTPSMQFNNLTFMDGVVVRFSWRCDAAASRRRSTAGERRPHDL